MVEAREQIIARAIGDGGNVTRGIAAIEALHRAGYAIRLPPIDPAPLVASLRQRGQQRDADDVEALAMELDRIRRGWGPSTPTEHQLRHSDLISARRFIEQAYEVLIELNMSNYTHDDVADANAGAVEAMGALNAGMRWINERLRTADSIMPDRLPQAEAGS